MASWLTPPGLNSPSLATTLQTLLLTLYRNWLGLPALSTRKHLNTYRNHLAQLLTDSSTNKAQLRQAITTFVEDAATLPGTLIIAEAALQTIRSTLKNSSELSNGERSQLASFFAAEDPTATALAQMVYHPNHLPETLKSVRLALDAAHPLLSPEASAAIDAILLQADQQAAQLNHAEQIKHLEKVLLTLEKLPIVRLLAWRELSAGKVPAEELAKQKAGAQSGSHGVTRGGESYRPWQKSPLLESMAELPAATPAMGATGEDEATSSRFFSDVRFPGTVKQGDEALLSVRLTRQQVQESVATVGVNVNFGDVQQPELVDVVVSAPGFGERFTVWHRTIKVYFDADSEPALFMLRGETLGKTAITIDFRHKERTIGTVTFGCEVTKTATTGKARLIGEGLEIGEFLTTPPPPADLELRIVLVEKTLHFTLHSANPKVGYHWQKVGETTLRAADPGKWLSDKIDQLNRLARISRDFGRTPTGSPPPAAADPTEIIEGIGTDLWDELVPGELRDEYWGLIKKLRDDGTLRSLLITSDEPWIPWEMLKPYRIDEYTQQSESDVFWAQGFAVCRWLSGRGPADEMKVINASIVAPVLDLANVKREVSGVRTQFSGHGVQVGDPLKTVAEVKGVISGATAQLLHFASHGSYEAENVERSRIALQDGVLMPDDLSLPRTANLRAARPLVFLNTCNAGRLGFTPTDLGGWADRLVRTVRAFAVIGAQWEVNDALAADFAEIFYRELLDGKALADAFQIARLAIQQKDPLNPTWLAYTLYGDPNSRVALPPDSGNGLSG